MTLSEFFTRVLPEAGRFVLFQNKRHSFFDSQADLVAAVEQRIDTQGLYYAVASYRDADTRKADNVHSLRSFRLDIDCGEAKFAKDPSGTYRTRDDGLAALMQFIRDTALVPSIIVGSGAGLHVYYCLDEDIGPGGWTQVAERLKALTKAKGLRADPTVTADAARILRPPGTLHSSGARVEVLRSTSTVYSLEAFSALLPAVEEDPLAGAVPMMRGGINDDILSGSDDRPASLARVADHCQVVRVVRDTHGCVPEPHWRGAAGVAKFCSDGEQLFHDWSSGYAGYSRREAQSKIDNWDTGPTTCRHFDDLTGKCDGCPHKGKITSPVQLGREPRRPEVPPPMTPEQAAKATVTVDQPIPGRPDLFDEDSRYFFRRNDEGKWVLYAGVRVRNKDDDGNEFWETVTKPVAARVFWLDHATTAGGQEGEGVILQLRVLMHNTRLSVESYPISASELGDERGIEKLLLKWGVVTDEGTKDARSLIRHYLLSEYRRIMDTMRPVSRGRFGFQQHDGQMIATLGGTAIFPDGHLQTAMYGKSLSAIGNVMGLYGLPPSSTGQWAPGVFDTHVIPNAQRYAKHLADHFNDPGTRLARLAICIGLAAPFMVFAADDPFTGQTTLPPTGMVVSLYSNASGRGKSAILQTVAAAYGGLSQVRAGDKNSITANSMETLAKITGVYPFLLDEVSRNESREVAQMVYQFANGTGKIRMDKDGVVRKSAETWAFPCLISTNVPQREMVEAADGAREALHMRLLELNFDSVPKREYNEAYTDSMAGLSGSFGSWGAVLVRRMLADIDAVRTNVRKSITEAFALLGNDAEYRFFARTLGTVLAMYGYMEDLIPFSKDEVVSVFRENVTDVSNYMARNTRTPSALFNDFINSISEHIAVTSTMEDNSVVLNLTKLRAPVYGRDARHDGVLWVSPKALNKFCQERNTSRAQVERDWAAAGLLSMNGKSSRWPINPFRGLPFAARETECLKLIPLQRTAAGTVVPLRSEAA